MKGAICRGSGEVGSALGSGFPSGGLNGSVSGGGGGMVKIFAGAFAAGNGATGPKRPLLSGRLRLGQTGSSCTAGSDRGTHIGYPEAAWTVVLEVSPLNRG